MIPTPGLSSDNTGDEVDRLVGRAGRLQPVGIKSGATAADPGRADGTARDARSDGPHAAAVRAQPRDLLSAPVGECPKRVKINEAIAAIALAGRHEPGFPDDIDHVVGGAIADGHPIGATGAVLTARVWHATARDGLQGGRVTLCIGGGQGIALLPERL